MKKKYAKLVREISSLQQEVEDVMLRKAEASQRIDEATAAIETLQADLKAALVSDDQKKTGVLEKKITELSDKIVVRDRLLVEGLQEKLSKLDSQLAELRRNKDKTFCTLAETWLQGEVSLYDSAAKALIEKIKRLLVAHSALREIGSAEIYRQALGQGYEHIPAARIPVLKDFNKADFLSGPFRSNPALRDSVFKEITG